MKQSLISRRGILRAISLRLVLALGLMGCLSLATMPAHADNTFAGVWQITLTIPAGPNSPGNTTLTLRLNIQPMGQNLDGRLTVTDEQNRVSPAVWRQAGKQVSFSYELPCPGDLPCATIVLRGKVKGDGTIIPKGWATVMWYTANNHNPALFDTSSGKFVGTRLQ